MAKKSKDPKPLSPELSDIYKEQMMRFLESQQFNSLDDINDFIAKNILGKRIDEIVPPKRGKKYKEQQSLDLVIQAMEQGDASSNKLIKEALSLWPENPKAHLFLGEMEPDAEVGLVHFKRAMEYAFKQLGGIAFFEENVGRFWLMVETRTYMSARYLFSQCLQAMGRDQAAIFEMEALLTLNPGDNQGVRYMLSSLLLRNKLLDKFEALYKAHVDDDSAIMNFNYALYLFVKGGPTAAALKALKKANAANKYILSYLTRDLEMPDILPNSYSLGSKEEALIYIDQSLEAWHACNALPWLYRFSKAN